MSRPAINKKKYHKKKSKTSSRPTATATTNALLSSSSHHHHHHHRNNNNNKNNKSTFNNKFPLWSQRRRGGPGMLLTCESGREVQCCREGLQILQYYYEQQQQQQQEKTHDSNHDHDNNNKNEKKSDVNLTIDEEIALLQQQQQQQHAVGPIGATKPPPFAMYETGCRGTVFLLCSLPNCALIPSSMLLLTQKQQHQQQQPSNSNPEEADSNPEEADSNPEEAKDDDVDNDDNANHAVPSPHDNDLEINSSNGPVHESEQDKEGKNHKMDEGKKQKGSTTTTSDKKRRINNDDDDDDDGDNGAGTKILPTDAAAVANDSTLQETDGDVASGGSSVSAVRGKKRKTELLDNGDDEDVEQKCTTDCTTLPSKDDSRVVDGTLPSSLPSPPEFLNPLPWDPIATVQSIIQDLSPATTTKLSSSSSSADPPPGSRYVTRMIPMQATCYASVEEIRVLGRALMQRYLHIERQGNNSISNSSSNDHKDKDNDKGKTVVPVVNKTKTFSIMVKRRICSNVTRDAIIDALATEVMNSGRRKVITNREIDIVKSAGGCSSNSKGDDDNDDDDDDKTNGNGSAAPSQPIAWKVDLKNPNVILQVEICKTICGMSVFDGAEYRSKYRNFNLIEIRTQQPEQ